MQKKAIIVKNQKTNKPKQCKKIIIKHKIIRKTNESDTDENLNRRKNGKSKKHVIQKWQNENQSDTQNIKNKKQMNKEKTNYKPHQETTAAKTKQQE